MKKTNQTRAEVILPPVTEVINGRIIQQWEDTIITAAVETLGTNSKTPVLFRVCSQTHYSFYSLSGNNYSANSCASYYGQQQEYGAGGQLF
jgi:hypothetical protein